jgi:hypothetical protein
MGKMQKLFQILIPFIPCHKGRRYANAVRYSIFRAFVNLTIGNQNDCSTQKWYTW